MWHYPSGKSGLRHFLWKSLLIKSAKFYLVRESSQTTLEALSAVRPWDHVLFTVILISRLQSFDGIRRRCLPKFYKALEPGTEDDRMKGALWALNVPVFGTSPIDLA
jgi:hypothetical protein